ncbi:hypothetical protein TNCV_3432471 [Trichonephila clavipes]|nr:hypothetical protein TNCV_3432471 [Trichonephila clavipes]
MAAVLRFNTSSHYYLGKRIANDDVQQDQCLRKLPFSVMYLKTAKRKFPESAIETSRNITARVIERETSGEIDYFLEDSRGFQTRQ